MGNNKNKKTRIGQVPQASSSVTSSQTVELSCLVDPETIKGTDDAGNFYNCHDDLTVAQAIHKSEYYRANNNWWSSGGYNGSTDEECMIGDTGAIEDGAEGLSFLDRYLASLDNEKRKKQQRRFDLAVDLGAGAGRVTKLVLLKRYNKVRLVEGDEGWSKRSRVYLGKKRAGRCSFVHARLDDLTDYDVRNWGEPADIMWIQWTLQYLVDADVVDSLRTLARGLRTESGILVVKENRPFGTAREDRFQMDVPAGENNRFDITRPDRHHRLLFQMAGLKVSFMERGVETNTYVLAAR